MKCKNIMLLGLICLLSLGAVPFRADAQIYGISYCGDYLFRVDEETREATIIKTDLRTSTGLLSYQGKLYTYGIFKRGREFFTQFIELDPETGEELGTMDVPLVHNEEGDIAIDRDGIGFSDFHDSFNRRDELWRFDVETKTSTVVSSDFREANLFDGLAFNRDGVLFGITSPTRGISPLLYIIERTGQIRLIGPTNIPDAKTTNGLAAGKDGTLYAAGDQSLYTLDPATGEASFFAELSGLGPMCTATRVSGISGLAYIEPEDYTIFVTAGEGGDIDPGRDIRLPEGGGQTFKMMPSPGYTVADVLVDGVSQGAIGSYTFRDVRADHRIEVRFQTTVVIPPPVVTEPPNVSDVPEPGTMLLLGVGIAGMLGLRKRMKKS